MGSSLGSYMPLRREGATKTLHTEEAGRSMNAMNGLAA